MELPSWDSRHPSIATMLNPALITVVLAAAANRYQAEGSSGMPWELSFLVAPMSFHHDTRKALPSRIDSHLPKWVERNPVVLAGLAPRARAMAPHVREGLRYGLRTPTLQIDAEGQLHGELFGRLPRKNGADVPDMVKAASFLGKWFATVGSSATVFAILGVTP
ncbi:MULTISPECIES: three component ABC system middle component [unclassified Rathayibacter]|jgi:hypothetical protein|uniref:three component ABC system middle component n=1 Tax=unclassified Rathayibacter TaxID=2609250 RepID=UPI0021574C3B|nr:MULTISPECIES: three component ABC system middle component [unclassified Rathayibacter]